MKKRSILFVILVLLILCIACVLPGALPEIIKGARSLKWREKTTPLSQEVVQDICIQFSLPAGDKRCQPGVTVYAPDFFQTITDYFRKKDDNWSTYEEVQVKLGKYQYELEKPLTGYDESEGFRAWYDLRGDQVYPIAMWFNSDGRLYRISASIGD